MTIAEFINLSLTLPVPMKIERDVLINGREYHVILYRQIQSGRDVIGTDMRSLVKKPKKEKSK